MNLAFDIISWISIASIIPAVVMEIRARRKYRQERGYFPMTPDPHYPFREWLRSPVATFLKMRKAVGENLATDTARYLIHLARVREYNEMVIERNETKDDDSDER